MQERSRKLVPQHHVSLFVAVVGCVTLVSMGTLATAESPGARQRGVPMQQPDTSIQDGQCTLCGLGVSLLLFAIPLRVEEAVCPTRRSCRNKLRVSCRVHLSCGHKHVTSVRPCDEGGCPVADIRSPAAGRRVRAKSVTSHYIKVYMMIQTEKLGHLMLTQLLIVLVRKSSASE